MLKRIFSVNGIISITLFLAISIPTYMFLMRDPESAEKERKHQERLAVAREMQKRIERSESKNPKDQNTDVRSDQSSQSVNDETSEKPLENNSPHSENQNTPLTPDKSTEAADAEKQARDAWRTEWERRLDNLSYQSAEFSEALLKSSEEEQHLLLSFLSKMTPNQLKNIREAGRKVIPKEELDEFNNFIDVVAHHHDNRSIDELQQAAKHLYDKNITAEIVLQQFIDELEMLQQEFRDFLGPEKYDKNQSEIISYFQ